MEMGMPYKKPRQSKTIRDFSAGALLGGLLVILWGVPAILEATGTIKTNPIPPEIPVAGATLLGTSGWAIKRRFATDTKIWR